MTARGDHAPVVGSVDERHSDVSVVVSAASPEIAHYTRMKIAKAIRHSRRPVVSAQVRVIKHRDCAVARPVIAQANVHLNGQLVRVQVAGTAALQAVDLLEARLRRRLETAGRRRTVHLAHRPATSDNQKPEWYGRPVEECRILRRKAFVLRHRSIDQAVEELLTLDYDFHLFLEAGSGQDSIVTRTPEGHVVVAQLDPDADHIAPCVTPYQLIVTPAPSLTLIDARLLLEGSTEPFLFFRPSGAARSLRGHVLYRRYDGHYGLIGW